MQTEFRLNQCETISCDPTHKCVERVPFAVAAMLQANEPTERKERDKGRKHKVQWLAADSHLYG